MQAQFGGLGRSGAPFLKIVTGAGEQSIAASSIAGFLKLACQIDSRVVGYFDLGFNIFHAVSTAATAQTTQIKNVAIGLRIRTGICIMLLFPPSTFGSRFKKVAHYRLTEWLLRKV